MKFLMVRKFALERFAHRGIMSIGEHTNKTQSKVSVVQFHLSSLVTFLIVAQMMNAVDKCFCS